MIYSKVSATRLVSVLLGLFALAGCAATEEDLANSEDTEAGEGESAVSEEALSVGPYLSNESGGFTVMQKGRYLASSKDTYRLYMQDDDNLVIYQLPSWKAIWSSGTWHKGVDRLYLLANGNLQLRETKEYYHTDVYCRNGVNWVTGQVGCKESWVETDIKVRWETKSSVTPLKARLYMQDDGNLVLYDISTWRAVWASNSWQQG